MTNFPLLTLAWLLPVVGSVVVLILPARRPGLVRAVALGTSLAVLAVTLVVAAGFDPSGEQYQFVESHSWIPAFGASYALGVDGIAVVLIVLTTVLVPILLVAAWKDVGDDGRRLGTYLALFLLVEAMVIVSFAALDILLFYILFEAMLVPMYFLIGGFGGEGRSAAAMKFLLYNLVGGLVMLAAVIGLYVVTSSAQSPFSSGTFDFRQIVTAVASGALELDPTLGKLLFLGFMFAFAVKAPLWPLHTWLPGAATSGTPATAVLMTAIVDKVGTFAMLRYALQLFPDAAATFTPAILTLAVISIIYSALVAIAQTDVLRLIAYTSISHFGFIVLGIFAMTSQAQVGATLYMVSHGLSTAALFLVAGFLVSRRRTRLIADYGGVQSVAPILAGTFLIAGLATLSLPGLAPFISEFLVLIGTYTRYPVAAVFASSALVLSAIYILWTYQRMMTGPVSDKNATIPDLRRREIVAVAPLLALLIVLGVYPKPVIEIITPAVTHTLSIIDRTDPAPAVAVEDGGTHR